MSAMELSPLQKAVWRHYYKGAKKELRKNAGMLLNSYDHYLPGKSAHSSGPPLVWRGTKKPEIEQLDDKGKFASSWAIGSKKRTFVASSPRKAWLYAKERPDSRIYGMTPAVLKRADAKVADQVGATSTNAPLRRGILKNEVRVLLKPKRASSEVHPTWRPTPLGEIQRKEFAGLIPDGYIRPGVVPETRDNKIATYRSPSSLKADVKDYRENFGGSLKEHYQSLAKTAGTKPKNVARGGIITLAPTSRLASLPGDLGESVRQYGEPALARRALRRHEIVHSILQQRRKGPPDTVAKLAGEEFTAYRKQLFGKKSPARHLPLGTRVRKIIDGTIDSTKRGKKTLGITKWFEELTAREMGMKEFEKPFLRYNAKRHARTGGLNDSFREKYNREHGSHLKRPVTEKPSELKPGSKSAKRRESFCARMSGVKGPTSKDGKLTPKGAALKRWNCSAIMNKVKEFSQTPEEERHELLKTGILSTGLAAGLALGGRSLRGTVGAAEKVAIKRATANKVAAARRNARVAGQDRAAEGVKAAKVAAKERYRAGNASFQNLARNPNLTKGEKEAVKRTHSIWKSANPNREFSSGARERSGSEKLRDGAIGAGALAAGGGILHAGLKVGRAADEVTPTAKAIRAVLSHGEQAAGNLRKGWLGRVLRLSSKNPTINHFALKTEEDGVPLTGRTAHDRFVKSVREGDLDRRDRNINRAAWAGAAAGWLTHGKGSTLNQRLGRLGLGAAAGMGGVLAIRAITDKHRDIYGDRPRWAKRAEALPTVAGVGAAGAILAKKAKLFARGDYARKVPGTRPNTYLVSKKGYESVLTRDAEGFAGHYKVSTGEAHRKVPVFRNVIAKAIRREKPLYNAARREAAVSALKKASLTPKAPTRLTPALAVAGAGGAWVGYAAARKEKKEFASRDREDTTIRDRVGAGVVGSASLYHSAPLVAGTKRVYHGTSQKAAKNILKEGLLPAKGGKSGSSKMSGDMYVKLSSGRSFVAASHPIFSGRSTAGGYANMVQKKSKAVSDVLSDAFVGSLTNGGSGKVLKAHIPYDDFKKNFHPSSLGGMANFYTEKNVPAEHFKPNSAMKAPKLKYIAKNPGRFAIGALGAGVGGALLKVAATPSKKSKEKKEFASRPSEETGHQVLKAGLSGAASGALLGGGTALLTRGKSLKSALQAAGIGAGAMGALAGGGTAIGNKVLGNADPNDKAAFTKRAAVGGALAGAALGGAGAIALKRGMLGAKASSAFAKGAKTWRPLHAIQTSGTPVAAAVGAGAGALYGAHQGADEGMMVDAINNSQLGSLGQNPNKKNLSAKIRGVFREFGYSSQLREKDTQRYVSPTRAAMGLADYDGSLGSYQVAKGFYNKGKKVQRWGGRGTNLLRDTGDVLAGRGRRTDQAGRPQKREWEKSWFHRAVGSAAAGGALLGGALLTSKTRLGQQHILPKLKKADAAAQKYGFSLFSIKLKRLKQFDLDAALAGWDVRDPRGKSARVFAPGSRPRFRREKEWHEKKENREALLKGAIVGTGLIGAAGGIAASRKISGLPMIPKLAKVVKRPYPVARPGEKPSRFANFVPNEHRGGNIEDFPIKFRPSSAA